MNHEPKFPMVVCIRDGVYRVSFIENGRNLDFMWSGSDLGMLSAKIGLAIYHKYRSDELKDHDERCAI